MSGIAILLTVLHSMMDMPFRNPAVVLMMLVVVHVDFKLFPCGRGKQIAFRVVRDNRATAAVRRGIAK